MGTNYDWAALVMTRAGAPVTMNNQENFTRWMAAENPVSDWYHFDNPLNCGLNDGSADGEGAYPDLDIAATYTAQVLRQGNMSPILNALQANSSLAAFSAGCARSAWSTGGYHNNPGYIASIPLPAVVPGPSFPAPPPTPTPTPEPVPTPTPSPKEYEIMDSVVAPNGDIVSHAVTTAGHYLEITRKAGNQGTVATQELEIIDVTAQYPEFVVQP